MTSLLNLLQKDYPLVIFAPADTFYWSPKQKTVFYNPTKTATAAKWALLHELSHALLNHNAYQTDFELLRLEVAAWQKAKDVASTYDIDIDEDHVQDCLDTYRNWLYARSTCPVCTQTGIQVNKQTYQCINCPNQWRVSSSRFCRPYRTLTTKKTLPM